MKTKKEIFRDILISAETKCVLKIKLKDQMRPIVTAVDKVIRNRIVLKPTCLYGHKLKQRVITLTDVEAVTRYSACFNHPLFERIRFMKNNLSYIRRDAEGFREPKAAILWPDFYRN